MLGQCIHLRGYNDGEEDVWCERKIAPEREETVRPYLIDAGFTPLNIDVNMFPDGEHIAGHAPPESRTRCAWLDGVMAIEPPSVWPIEEQQEDSR